MRSSSASIFTEYILRMQWNQTSKSMWFRMVLTADLLRIILPLLNSVLARSAYTSPQY